MNTNKQTKYNKWTFSTIKQKRTWIGAILHNVTARLAATKTMQNLEIEKKHFVTILSFDWRIKLQIQSLQIEHRRSCDEINFNKYTQTETQLQDKAVNPVITRDLS